MASNMSYFNDKLDSDRILFMLGEMPFRINNVWKIIPLFFSLKKYIHYIPSIFLYYNQIIG